MAVAIARGAVDEIVSEWQMVMLRGQKNADAGEQYGRSFEKPLVTAVVPYSGTASSSSKAKSRAAITKPGSRCSRSATAALPRSHEPT